jgi:hypothetical protein
MRALDVARTAFDAVRIAIRGVLQTSEFICGDCERQKRCSLPSSNNCIAKAEQMARGDWKSKKRYKRLAGYCGY